MRNERRALLMGIEESLDDSEMYFVLARAANTLKEILHAGGCCTRREIVSSLRNMLVPRVSRNLIHRHTLYSELSRRGDLEPVQMTLNNLARYRNYPFSISS